jgi:hypothetical protein
MKRKDLLSFVIFCSMLLSCRHHGDLDIKVTESKHHFSMEAWFHEYRTRDVEEYMDKKIGKESDLSFVNTRMDGKIRLDDHTTFFMKKSPGHLKIDLDKHKNSVDSYREIKAMCEGIKEVLR